MVTSHVIVINRLKVRQWSEKAKAACNTMLTQIAMEIEGDAADLIRKGGHVYKGNLFKDVTTERFEEKGILGINCYVTGKSAKYAQVIHDQRVHPGKQPPYSAISDWVAEKLGIAKDDKKHYPVTRQICRNIAKHGLKSIGPDGLQYFWNPLKLNKDRYLEYIARAIRKVQP